MAKLLTKKGKVVECNILNESFETYVIEYRGKVGQVKKDRILSMNSIDEGVLSKFKERVKKLAGKIMQRWIQVIYDQDTLKSFIHTPNEETDGKPIDIMPPVVAILAKSSGANIGDVTNYNYVVPCQKTIDYLNHLGFEYNGGNLIKGDTKGTNESVNEDNNTPASGLATNATGRHINLSAYGTDYDKEYNGTPSDEDAFLFDVDYEDALSMIIELYNSKAKYPNFHPKNAPCFLGAPGNAKSAIINEALDRIRALGYKDVEGISVIFSGHAEGTLYMSSPVKHIERGRGGKTVEKQDWIVAPMLGIPAYANNPKVYSKDELEVLKDNANGLIVDENGKVIKEAEGGIFVIDEFTRINQDVMPDVMNILSGNPFGNNLVFGDRWVVIVCGNRKADMQNLASAQDTEYDSAQRTRLAIHNMVLRPEEFIKWSQKPNKAFKNLVPNIIPEITAFIKAYGDRLYSVQMPEEGGPEYFNVWADAANARSWEGVSNEMYSAIIMQDPTFFKMNCLMDLIQSNPAKYNDAWIKRRVAAHIGVNIATEFVNFLHTMEFGREEAIEVYDTGTCAVKSAAPSLMIPIIDRLAQCNPGYLQYGENATAEQLFTGQQLVNIINYIYNLCLTMGGQGSGGETAISALRRFWTTFQIKCVEKYKGLGGTSLIHNFTELDPDDPGTDAEPNYVPKPGYEKFIGVFNKYLNENQDKLAAMREKGLI